MEKFNLPIITIDTEQFLIAIRPLQLYYVIEFTRYVVTYQIEYRNKAAHEIKTTILTYYISDGKTNNFAGNLVLPFLCIHKPKLKVNGKPDIPYPNYINDTSCPVVINKKSEYSTDGLLFKVSDCENLNLKEYNKIIIDESISKGFEFGPKKFCNLSEGLCSVLPRFNNIINFLIAVSSKKIYNVYQQINPGFHELLNNPLISIKSQEIGPRLNSDILMYLNSLYNIFYIERDQPGKFNPAKFNEEIPPLQRLAPGDNINELVTILLYFFISFRHKIQQIRTIQVDYMEFKADNIHRLETAIQLNQILNVCLNNEFNETIEDNITVLKEINNIVYIYIKELPILSDIVNPGGNCPVNTVKKIIKDWGASCRPSVKEINKYNYNLSRHNENPNYGYCYQQYLEIIDKYNLPIDLLLDNDYRRFVETFHNKDTDHVKDTKIHKRQSMCRRLNDEIKKEMEADVLKKEKDQLDIERQIRLVNSTLEEKIMELYTKENEVLKDEVGIQEIKIHIKRLEELLQQTKSSKIKGGGKYRYYKLSNVNL